MLFYIVIFLILIIVIASYQNITNTTQTVTLQDVIIAQNKAALASANASNLYEEYVNSTSKDLKN